MKKIAEVIANSVNTTCMSNTVLTLSFNPHINTTSTVIIPILQNAEIKAQRGYLAN